MAAADAAPQQIICFDGNEILKLLRAFVTFLVHKYDAGCRRMAGEAMFLKAVRRLLRQPGGWATNSSTSVSSSITSISSGSSPGMPPAGGEAKKSSSC
eukprot:3519156-Pyramimonas_sp.AAC.1